ncbi:FMN-binding protein [Amycolatopsis rhizosphaerae]|uniref:FMN-binding protein n=1 Tax=Amycolatopsis rhizosphaerae TaxID=2053003 RepID=A0A558A7C5_9PSEU|nr:FMN-binding protein [Amycolatopsis rhizosphaerae]TVT20169.1 FMN-binding protein [Amycolatopsis rhizosphaerae]
MKRIVLWFLGTASLVALLFGYHTSTSGALAGNAAGTGPAPPKGSTGTSAGSSAPGSKTYTGPSVDTRWGPVRVQITVADKKITNVSVVDYPDGNGRDRQINSYALPILVRSTLDAQSANIDMISGATVTSEGYVQSLQGALDQAGL